MSYIIYNENCLDAMKRLESNSVDSIVTDPPYGLNFMGKKWDYDVPSTEIWAECLRVLKPGGHLLAFAGTRTQHRMAVRIEDAGFEIRDMIAWVYGCLDESTEVATESGLKPYHKTKIGDRVLCYDVEHGEYTYQPILEIVEYDYSDTAYRLVGDFGEQVVSRNHRVIVEHGGSEAFQLAETLEREARVPVLESLPALRQAVHDAYQGAGCSQQDVRCRVCEFNDRRGELGCSTAGSAQGRDDQMCGLPDERLEAERMAAKGNNASLQLSMQRHLAREGVGDSCPQGACELDNRIGGRAERKNDWRIKPGLERRVDVPESEGCVCASADQVRSLPCNDAVDGAVGRLRDGAPIAGGAGDCSGADAGGVRPPHQPRCDGQPSGKPDAVCHERATQGIRAWGGHRSVVVRVVPFHYTGKVWCLRVPTGAFVAVRNGVAFPTGNSGFPKSMDVSKAIDKTGGASVAWFGPWFRKWREEQSITQNQVASLFLSKTGGLTGCVANWELGLNMPTPEQFNLIRDSFGLPFESIEAAQREVIGQHAGDLLAVAPGQNNDRSATTLDITAPATEAARQWQGWGTALKPALEPVTVARKPLVGTVAANVLEHGTGALNINGCRVGTETRTNKSKARADRNNFVSGFVGGTQSQTHDHGRWPANLIHDGSDEVLAQFPETGTSAGGKSGHTGAYSGGFKQEHYGDAKPGFGDKGSAARFFYCAKASKKDRDEGLEGFEEKQTSVGDNRAGGDFNERLGKTPGIRKNIHPTVKPTALMRYLCRLVTPPGGVVLDPFTGSGSTGKAAMLEGFSFIGCELSDEYAAIAIARIQAATNQKDDSEPSRQMNLL